MAEIHELLGRESVELVMPLMALAMTLQRGGHLNDAYNVMMRLMLLSEKIDGEEGPVTCQMRTLMGEPL